MKKLLTEIKFHLNHHITRYYHYFYYHFYPQLNPKFHHICNKNSVNSIVSFVFIFFHHFFPTTVVVVAASIRGKIVCAAITMRKRDGKEMKNTEKGEEINILWKLLPSWICVKQEKFCCRNARSDHCSLLVAFWLQP